jgi:uncharacterized protein (DUF983 family)
MPGLEIHVPEPLPAENLAAPIPRPGAAVAMARGLRQRCPRCGNGHLFRRYLKPVGVCPLCGEALGHIRADDAPPYFTIAIVGHVVVPLVMFSERFLAPPTWLHLAVWPALTLLLTCGLLPLVKGTLIGLMWHLRLRGDEHQ